MSVIDKFLKELEDGGRSITFLGKGVNGVVFAFGKYVLKFTSDDKFQKEIDCIKYVNNIPGIPRECLIRYVESETKPTNEYVFEMLKEHKVDNLLYKKLNIIVTKNIGEFSLNHYLLRENNLRYKDVLDVFKQIIWIIYILHKHDYVHGDMHGLNVFLKENIEGKSLKFDFQEDVFGEVNITPRYIVLPIDYESCSTSSKERSERKREDLEFFLSTMICYLEISKSREERSVEGKISDIGVKLNEYFRKLKRSPHRGESRIDFVDMILKEILCSHMFGLDKLRH
jgi:serine/threonine protein kinase